MQFGLESLLLAGFLSIPGTPKATPPLVVIVNANSGITHLSREEVTDIFMGRQKRLTSGLVALPVEPVGDPGPRSRFYQMLVNVPLSQVRSYWARLYFSGLAQPPRQAQTPEEVIEVVMANRGAIGFLEQSKLDRRVKGVLVLQEAEAP